MGVSPVAGCARRPRLAQCIGDHQAHAPGDCCPLTGSAALGSCVGLKSPLSRLGSLALSRAVPGPTFGERGEVAGSLSQMRARFSAPTVHGWARGCSCRPPRPWWAGGRRRAPRSALPGAQEGAPRGPGQARLGAGSCGLSSGRAAVPPGSVPRGLPQQAELCPAGRGPAGSVVPGADQPHTPAWSTDGSWPERKLFGPG